MKKQIPIVILLLLITSNVFAADFCPTILKLTADPVIQYDFDGSDLSIPVQVSGTTAGIVFCVFTRGMAGEVTETINGFLGWHHVNKVDTCIYYSSLKSVGTGATTITWDGRDQDGNIVSPDDYTYYLWAFDNQSEKQLVCHHVVPHSTNFTIVERDRNDLPLSNPLYITRETVLLGDSLGLYKAINFDMDDPFGSVIEKIQYTNIVQRWVIGSDPSDLSLVSSSRLLLDEYRTWYGCPAVDPHDPNLFYVRIYDTQEETGTIAKYKWISGGVAESQEAFGISGMTEKFSVPHRNVGAEFPTPHFTANVPAGVACDRTYLYTDVSDIESVEPNASLLTFDMSGSLINRIDLTAWWSSSEDFEITGQMNSGISTMHQRHGNLFLNSSTSCMKQMINPARYLSNVDVNDIFVWTNRNGDYILDKNFEETATNSWVCNDAEAYQISYCISSDDHLFSICPTHNFGFISFALMAPDGTGIGHFSFAGESTRRELGNFVIDGDTPFDGLYTFFFYDMHRYYPRIFNQTFYFAHDSIKGVIVPFAGASVEEKLPKPFTLSQNRPNPFNPVTIIPFTIPQESRVTLAIYNLAGKKVAVLADNVFLAGEHSVEWDAGRFSSGVYLYKLEAGEFVETKKMMLIR